jgi:membrane-anchored glycerophosphoryl diester phosphodiesterase (GDPDase)
VPINYICKTKQPKTHLEQQSAIKVKNLFIPSFIKSLLYFGLMMLILYLGWLLIVLPVIISLIGIEILWCFVRNKKQQVRKASYDSNEQKQKKKINYFRCINI